MRALYFYLVCFLLVPVVLSAQSKKGPQAGSKTPQVVEATVQKTIFGRQETHPRVDYRFVLVWQGPTPPGPFFWHPDASTWRDVTLAKPEKRPGLGPNDFMIVEKHTKYQDIHAGDRIIVSPHSHSDEVEEVPAAVKKLPVSSLYYKIGDKWMYVTIKPTKRPDIVMP